MQSTHFHKKNVGCTGGGTGGHVLPIVSLIQYAQEHTQISSKYNSISWFGEKGSFEEKKASELEGVSFYSVLSGKWRRERSISAFSKNCRDLLFVSVGFFQAVRGLKKNSIDVLFCKGGYVALPVVCAAYVLKIPIIVHESDTHSGLVNRIAHKLGKKTFVGFEGSLEPAELVGQILSQDLLQPEKIDLSSYIGNEKKICLVACGSLGSSSIFDQLLIELDRDGLFVKNSFFVVLLGLINTSYRRKFEKYPNVLCVDFMSQKQLGYVYSRADISICRGGTTTLQELDVFGIKKIIIPLKWTHDQLHNARRYVMNCGDKLLEQDSLSQLGTILDEEYSLLSQKKDSSLSPDSFFDPHKKIRSSLLGYSK